MKKTDPKKFDPKLSKEVLKILGEADRESLEQRKKVIRAIVTKSGKRFIPATSFRELIINSLQNYSKEDIKEILNLIREEGQNENPTS